MNKVYLDFEFNNTRNKYVNLVSCALSFNGKSSAIWLKDNEENKLKLKNWLLNHSQYTMVGYATTAEARSFMSLGLNPRDFKWIDLFAEWRQLTFNNNDCQYGTYFQERTGFKKKSIPPHYNPAFNEGKDNTEIGKSLSACVGRLLEINIDSAHKNKMRDLIISNIDFSDKDKQAILDYNKSDIKYLEQIDNIMMDKLHRELSYRGVTKQQIENFRLDRGRYSANVAIMESEGIPIDVYSLNNLIANKDLVTDTLITSMNELYPFYTYKKTRQNVFYGKWVDDYSQFKKFIENHPLIDARKWELTGDEETPNRKYKRDDKYLEKYDGTPELKQYRQTKKILGQMKWFKGHENKSDDFVANIGDDDRVRAYFGPFGTQTCIAGDALVYSKQRGFIRITEVSAMDLLWDGEQFVKHAGLKYNGLKKVIDFNGIRVTPDHKFLDNDNMWKEAKDCHNPLNINTPIVQKDERVYSNPSNIKVSRMCKKTGKFESGYIATNVHFSDKRCTHTKDRYVKNNEGFFLGDVLSTPSYYKEAHIKWKSMIRRANNSLNRLSYNECIVHDSWKNFSNFAEWYENNINPYNKNPVIDKDYIIKGNKEYGPKRCLVITDRLNSLIVGSTFKKKSSNLPTGVHLVDNVEGLYAVRISIDDECVHIGYFDNLSLASEAYSIAKTNIFHEILEQEKQYLTESTYKILKTFHHEKGCEILNLDDKVPVYDILDCGPNNRFAIYNNNLEGYIAHNCRNAPKASQFILAMSAWLRCLVKAPEGYVVTELDFASQEFIVAACLSNDPVMIDAYLSGDPYMYFGKYVGYMPKNATKESHKDERTIMKNIILGSQFGLSAFGMSIHLTNAMKRFVSEDEAQKLINYHKSAFKVYWKWQDKELNEYHKYNSLLCADGWALLKDNPNSLSIKNFLVQGTSASILRSALENCLNNSVKVIATLHDAMYIISKEEDLDNDISITKKCMDDAVRKILGKQYREIRIEASSHRHDEVFISDKGRKFYELLKDYLNPKESEKEKDEKLMELLYI